MRERHRTSGTGTKADSNKGSDRSRQRRGTRSWLAVPILAIVSLLAAITIANSVSAVDGIVYYSHLESQGDIADFVKANPGKDVVVLPEDDSVVPSQQRRLLDEERASEDDLDQTAEPTLPISSCEAVARADGTAAGRFLLCDGAVISVPSKVDSPPASSDEDRMMRLVDALGEMLGGISGSEAEMGFGSPFRSAESLTSAELDESGRLEVDFNELIIDDLAPLNVGYETHLMLEQLLRTVFQFEEVASLTLTLDGDCDGFADLYGNSCFTWTRGLWETQNRENGVDVSIVSLDGKSG